MRESPLSRHHLYVYAVISIGLPVVCYSLWQFAMAPPGIQWFILATLTLLTGSFTVKVPSLPARISVSEPFVFTAVLLFGSAAGTITVLLDALVISFWMKRPKGAVHVLFNAAALAIAIRFASDVFFWMSGVTPGELTRQDITRLILPVFAFAILYFAVNTWLVAGALATERRESIVAVWLRNFPAVGVNYIVGSSIAMLIVAYTDAIDVTVLSIIIPLLVISYLTFRTSMGRLADADRHVAQVNELYLSTVETLAMAVDAKDQITHGHIRRVQVYATELAKRLGVTDDRQLKAIGAAALLHDMGKLAIPEHILNKPGSLTPAEFERMKQHADLGADLLSSIRFPYPVVPIVRHHHENWNGAGYPSGIAGTDIPLGARVLSVVDCFDALTSDRPYRPRLSSEEAFKILRERRGTMYDPLVVDTFISAYSAIAPAAIKAGQEARSIFNSEVPDCPSADISKPLKQIRASASETALLVACSQNLGKASSTRESVEIATQCLRHLIPATVYALYRPDPKSDTLVCDIAVGDPQRLLDGLTIRLAERVTGWTGANRRCAVNSDASLDLAQIAQNFQPPLRSTISTPLVAGERLIAVLTAYSPKEEAFNESHRYTFEQVASLLLDRLSSMRSGNLDSVVSFPVQRNLRQ
jgi:putative nucleotidyltransferase with HDIG domain